MERFKKYAIIIAKIGFSISVLYYCFTLVNLENLWLSIVSTNPLILIFSFFINFVGTIICKSVMIWKLMNISGKVSIIKLILINLGLRFYTIFLPRSIVTTIRWYKYRALSDGRKSFTLLTFDAILTLFFLSVGSLYFYYLTETKTVPSPILITLVVFFILLATLLSCFLSSNILTITNRISKSILTTLKLRRVNNQIELFFKSIKSLELSDRKNIFFTVGASFSSYILFIISAYLTAMAISLPVSLIEVAWARSMILLIAHIPISIAGLGLRELGFVTLFGYLGLSADQAMGYALISFGLQIGLACFGAIIEVAAWLKKKDD